MNWMVNRTPMLGGYTYSITVHGWPTFSAQSMYEGKALAEALSSLPVPELPHHTLRNWFRDGRWTQQNGTAPLPYISTTGAVVTRASPEEFREHIAETKAAVENLPPVVRNNMRINTATLPKSTAQSDWDDLRRGLRWPHGSLGEEA